MKEVDETIDILTPSKAVFNMRKTTWTSGYEFEWTKNIQPRSNFWDEKTLGNQAYHIAILVSDLARERFDIATMKFEIDKENIRRDVFNAMRNHVASFADLMMKDQPRTKRRRVTNFINSINYSRNEPMVELIYGIWKMITNLQDTATTQDRQQVMTVIEVMRGKYSKDEHNGNKRKRKA